MPLLSEYLSSRKQKRVLELLRDHAGRCKAVGNTLGKLSAEWLSGAKDAALINKQKIHTEEKSADNIEADLILEVAKSGLPDTKMKEDLINFVRMLDSAAGAAKRAATNMILLLDHPLPPQHGEIVRQMCEVLEKIFEKVEDAVISIDDVQKVISIRREIDLLEDDVDRFYEQLKEGYFEIEKTFSSAAALIILDHVSRDLEASADKSEDAADLLSELVQRVK